MRKTSRSRRRRRTPAEIRQIVADFEASGLAQREFATRHGIPLSTLQSWLRRLTAKTTSPAAELIPVGVVAGPPPVIEIELPGGVVIRVDAGVRAADLQTVLETLRSC
jgi:transposase-like protein